MIRICDKYTKQIDYINTTSRSKTWSKGLSPFFLGPVNLYDTYISQNVENAWQYSKVYPQFVDECQNPTEDYFIWANIGWTKSKADRYPMGKNTKPLYSYWNKQKLTYIQARKIIYAPLYAKTVQNTQAFKQLQEIAKTQDVWLWDFDGYDHTKLNMSYQDVMNCTTRKMGHAFVLAMLLDNQKIWES